jgi:cell wall-associated NlpC family hydrolase
MFTYFLMPMRIFSLILCGLFLNVCSADDQTQLEQAPQTTWSTDVIGIEEMHLSVNYWVNQAAQANQVLMNQEQISAFKKDIYSSNPHMLDLTQYPDHISAEQLQTSIEAISRPNKSELYDPDGKTLGPETYQTYRDNLNLENIAGTVSVRFALVVNRTDMRTYPTVDSYYKKKKNQNLDRFQENGLFPGDALAVLHTSADQQWSFVQSYNYAAWVRTEYIAIGDRKIIHDYKNAKDFMIVTGDKVWTSFNPEIPALSELQLDMGIRIPLAERDENNNNLYGQNPYTSHTVLLPVRQADGGLLIKQALIARNQDVNVGFLPFTRENVIRQAFKFLGERYGWGHSYNARDCTGFVMEVYKTFGIYMPRNTGQQGEGSFGQNRRFTAKSPQADKLQAFRSMDIGDLIYVPGHVLMYIGDVDGEPYVIHDVSVFRYTDEHGKYYEGTLNGVSVTPLIPLYGSRESTYVELMYNIKSIR